jgi:hypothetical protein
VSKSLLSMKGITEYLSGDEILEEMGAGNVEGACPRCCEIMKIEYAVIDYLKCPNCTYEARVRSDFEHQPIKTLTKKEKL